MIIKLFSSIKFFFNFLFIIALTLGLSISCQSLLAAWTAPLANPSTCLTGNPGCNAPINDSSTAQYKAGALGLGGTLRGYSTAVFDGNVGIGTTNPGYNLDLSGTMHLTGDIFQNYGGQVFIGDTVCPDMSASGLCINMAGQDSGAIVLKSSDVGHPITELAEADTYGVIAKSQKDAGGIGIISYKDADQHAGFVTSIISYLGESAYTGHTSVGYGMVDMNNYVTDGGINATTVNANGNLFSIRNASTAVFIADAEGDVFTNSINSIGTAGLGLYDDGGNGLFIKDGGNIGIGTANPGQKLSVVGIIESASGGFKFPDGTTQTTAAAGGSSQWTTSGSNIYYSAGNVGIGTANPGQKLHISGGGILLDNNQFFYGKDTAGTNRALIGKDDNNNTRILTGSSNKIIFAPGNTQMVEINSSGNVGIGTASPGARLQINPSISSEAIRIVTASDWSPLNIRNSANTADIFRVDQSGILQVGSVPWARLSSFPSACSSGQYVTGVGATLTCAAPAGGGDITGVTAGTGLTGGGLSGDITIAADTAYLQRRVSSACAAGSSISAINADGTVSCETDDVGSVSDIWVNTAGDTMTGNLTVNKATPLINLTRTSGNPEIDLGDATNHWGIYNDYADANKLKFWYGSNLLQIDTSGNLTLSGTVDGIDISAQAPNWTTAYNERRQWDGGAANLVAATARTSLGLNALASATLSCSANQIPKWNGSAWACADDASQWTTSGSNVYYNTGNVGIGTASPGAKLEVAGQIKITGGAPGTGKVLTSDATGLAAWQSLTTFMGDTGKYQVSCSFAASSVFSGNLPACCRIETKNGLTSCKWSNGTSWVDIGDPFGGALTSGNTGKYNIECTSFVIAGYGSLSCGRLNTETGASDQCKYYRDSSWINCPGGSAW